MKRCMQPPPKKRALEYGCARPICGSSGVDCPEHRHICHHEGWYAPDEKAYLRKHAAAMQKVKHPKSTAKTCPHCSELNLGGWLWVRPRRLYRSCECFITPYCQHCLKVIKGQGYRPPSARKLQAIAEIRAKIKQLRARLRELGGCE